MEAEIYQTRVKIFAGDISRQEVGAVVNPTATTLLSQDPVDLMLRKTGGLSFLKECRHYTARNGGVPVGEAVVTGAGRLAAQFVIHAVAPEWAGGLRREERTLRRLYRSILRCADEAGVASVAIPAVGAGPQGIPRRITAKMALSTVRDYALQGPGLREIRFVLLSKYDVEEYIRIWELITYNADRSLSTRYA